MDEPDDLHELERALLDGIRAHVPRGVEVLAQGPIIAERLEDWLGRHPEMERRLGRGGSYRVLTTDKPSWFGAFGERVLGEAFEASEVRLRALRG